jgi:hypothetical protein
MPITHSDLMAITIPSDADHRRSEATLGCSYHAEVIAGEGVRGEGAAFEPPCPAQHAETFWATLVHKFSPPFFPFRFLRIDSPFSSMR